MEISLLNQNQTVKFVGNNSKTTSWKKCQNASTHRAAEEQQGQVVIIFVLFDRKDCSDITVN